MGEKEASAAGKLDKIRYGMVALLAAALVAFMIDNTQSVRVGFVFSERNPPLVWVLILTASLAIALDRLIRWKRNR